MITVVAGILSLVKEKVKGHSLTKIYASAAAASLLLGYHQFQEHSSWKGLGSLTVNIEIGFFLALVSLIPWLISLLIKTQHKIVGIRRWLGETVSKRRFG